MPSPTSSFCSPLSFGCLLTPTPSFKASLCTEAAKPSQGKTETAAEAHSQADVTAFECNAQIQLPVTCFIYSDV